MNHKEQTYFEIHVTVKPMGVMQFRTMCVQAGVKPIVLYLQLTGEEQMMDMMTSSKIIGTYRACWTEVNRIVKKLTQLGATVVRRKIESSPLYSEASKFKKGDARYFEAHVGVDCYNGPSNGPRQDALWSARTIADIHGARMSNNVFKKAGDFDTHMITLRHRDRDCQSFQYSVNQMVTELRQHFTIDKVITEFILFDDNERHDEKWIGNN